MKVGIIGPFERNDMPYIDYYEKALKDNKCIYSCVFWNRNINSNIRKNGNEYTICIKGMVGLSKIKKIIPMIKYRYYLEEIIRKEKYTHLIILNTIPGVLLSNILLNNFRGKYILDIRDYSYENYRIYKKCVEKLINNSFFTAISSEGFKKFLPKSEKLTPCHNISNIDKKIETCNNLDSNKTIRIGFVGTVRYFNENSKLIQTLSKYNKYNLLYYGKTNINCDLRKYCKKNNIKNVQFFGSFKNEEKPEIYKNIDLINAVYGNNNLEVTTALPNRLYDGVLFKKPIIATQGTYLGEVVEKYKLGIAINIDDKANIETEINNYITNFESNKFVNQCNEFLNFILKQQTVFENKILNFLLRKEE